MNGKFSILNAVLSKINYPRYKKNTDILVCKATLDRAHLIEETLSPFLMSKNKTYKIPTKSGIKLSFIFDLEGEDHMFYRNLMLCSNNSECCI
jgi:hypothetical protein